MAVANSTAIVYLVHFWKLRAHNLGHAGFRRCWQETVSEVGRTAQDKEKVKEALGRGVPDNKSSAYTSLAICALQHVIGVHMTPYYWPFCYGVLSQQVDMQLLGFMRHHINVVTI